MSDLQARFATLDRVSAPDMWADIQNRAAGKVVVGRPVVGGTASVAERRPMRSLAWVIAVTLVAVLSIAVGGLVVGAWHLNDLQPPIVPTPSPLPAVTSAPRTSSFECGEGIVAEDQTGLMTACRVVPGVTSGSMTRADLRLSNPPSSGSRLQAVWVVANCDVGATIQFENASAGYSLTLTRTVEEPCVPGTGLAAVELEFSQAMPAEDVTGEMIGGGPPSPASTAPEPGGVIPDCPGATGAADIVDTYLVGNELASWTSAPPGIQDEVQAGSLAVVTTDETSPVIVVVTDPTTGSLCNLAYLSAGARVASLSWSPSGDALAMSLTSQGTAASQVVVWSPSGITRPWIGHVAANLAWSSDGARLAVGGYRNESSTSAILQSSGSAQLKIDEPTERTLWSPDGSQLALWKPSGPFGPDAHGTLTIVDSLTCRATSSIDIGFAQPLAWLEGDTILMFDHATGQRSQVSLSNPTETTAVAEYGHEGLWSPDLSFIATIESEETRDELVIYDSTGGRNSIVSATAINPEAELYQLAWSPDSLRIAFSLRVHMTADVLGIWTVDRDGTNLRPLVAGSLDLMGTETRATLPTSRGSPPGADRCARHAGSLA